MVGIQASRWVFGQFLRDSSNFPHDRTSPCLQFPVNRGHDLVPGSFFQRLRLIALHEPLAQAVEIFSPNLDAPGGESRNWVNSISMSGAPASRARQKLSPVVRYLGSPI